MSSDVPAVLSVSDCRPEVQAFAILMERKLRKHDKKGARDNWLRHTPWSLLKRLEMELSELRAALSAQTQYRWWPREPGEDHRGRISRIGPMGVEQLAELNSAYVVRSPDLSEATAFEAADVANFAMMVADVCGGIDAPIEFA